MTGKQRIRAAFSEEGAREFGAVIPYESIYIRDNWEAVTSCPWWYQYEPDIQKQLEWRSQAAEAIGQDWFHVPSFYSRDERPYVKIEQSGQNLVLVNEKTQKRRELLPPVRDGWGHVMSSPDFDELPQTEDDIDRLIIPIENDPGPPVVTDGRDDLCKAVMSGFGSGLYPISHVGSPLWSLYSTWGYEGLMMMIASRPDLVRRACSRLYPKVLRRAREGVALGAEAIWIEECLTDQISPQSFAEINVPIMSRLVKDIRALGARSIYYFCGDPGGKLDHILSVGADAVSLEESKKGFVIDILEIAREVKGRCVLLGNLAAVGVLQKGSDADLKAAIEYQIEAGRVNKGRFVMSLGMPVAPDTPPSRVRLYCELTHELSA